MSKFEVACVALLTGKNFRLQRRLIYLKMTMQIVLTYMKQDKISQTIFNEKPLSKPACAFKSLILRLSGKV